MIILEELQDENIFLTKITFFQGEETQTNFVQEASEKGTNVIAQMPSQYRGHNRAF